MAVVFSDAFTGALNQLLSDYSASWVRHSASASGANARINASERAAGADSAGTTLYYNTDAGVLTDCLVEGDVYIASTTSIAGVCARVASGANTFYHARWNSGQVQCYKFVAGTATQLGSSYAASATVGQTHGIGIRAEGDQVSVTWDGATVLGPFTDTSIASGYPGLRLTAGGTNLEVDNLTVDDLAAADTTAPNLTSPTGTATGSTTASGSVSTDEANGTLYAVVTTSSTAPSAAQVQAGQDHTGAAAAYATSQAVSATGVQNVTATGLTAETTYYWHYCHEDASGNDSAVVSSASFTTDAAGGGSTPIPVFLHHLRQQGIL